MAQRTHPRATPGTRKNKSFARIMIFQEYNETCAMEALVRLMGITEGSVSEKYRNLPAQRCFGDRSSLEGAGELWQVLSIRWSGTGLCFRKTPLAARLRVAGRGKGQG